MKKHDDIISTIYSYSDKFGDSLKVIDILVQFINRIPKSNLGELSNAELLDNGIRILLQHANDGFRRVSIHIVNDFMSTEICFMKDSLTYQLYKNKYSIDLRTIAPIYFESIFGDSFQKEIYYRNKKIFQVILSFDDSRLKNRLYISLKNLVKTKLFGTPSLRVEKYRYLSFFKTYDYVVKNEIIYQ